MLLSLWRGGLWRGGEGWFVCALGMRWGFGGGSRWLGGGSSRRLNRSRGGPRRRVWEFGVSCFVCVFEMVIGGGNKRDIQ